MAWHGFTSTLSDALTSHKSFFVQDDLAFHAKQKADLAAAKKAAAGLKDGKPLGTGDVTLVKCERKLCRCCK